MNYIATGANATTWPQYVARYANLTAYPLAVAGATCSNALSPRVYRDVSKDQLALYRNLTGTVRLDPRETVYSLWIGEFVFSGVAIGEGGADWEGRDE